MNKKLLTIILLIGFSIQVKGQKLVENKVDEFTGNQIKRTSWVTTSIGYSRTNFGISKINNNFYLNLKMLKGGVFSIAKGANIMFKLTNEEIITLSNNNYEITCTGCGAIGFVGSAAQGINTSYDITTEQLTKLKNIGIKKIRIYTSDGYLEDDLKSKHDRKIKKAISLILI